jgi:hypothetical protein
MCSNNWPKQQNHGQSDNTRTDLGWAKQKTNCKFVRGEKTWTDYLQRCSHWRSHGCGCIPLPHVPRLCCRHAQSTHQPTQLSPPGRWAAAMATIAADPPSRARGRSCGDCKRGKTKVTRVRWQRWPWLGREKENPWYGAWRRSATSFTSATLSPCSPWGESHHLPPQNRRRKW